LEKIFYSYSKAPSERLHLFQHIILGKYLHLW